MIFPAETNMDSVRRTALAFLNMEIKPTEFSPLIIHHPFFSTGIVPASSEYGTFRVLNIMDDPDALAEAKRLMMTQLEEATTLAQFFIKVHRPYRLVFLKFIMKHLSKRDFSKMFGWVWVDAENPSMDVNVSIHQLVWWFHKAEPEHLMDKDDLVVYKELKQRPEILIYRGVGIGRNPIGLSWTMNKEKAEWFAHRFDRDGRQGYVQAAYIRGEDILAYFNTSGEEEIVTDSRMLVSAYLNDEKKGDG